VADVPFTRVAKSAKATLRACSLSLRDGRRHALEHRNRSRTASQGPRTAVNDAWVAAPVVGTGFA